MAVMTFQDCRSAAHWLRNQGASVFPLRARDKRPAFKWDEWKTSLPTHAQIDAWFSSRPDSNLALVCGAVSGIVVVDVDGEQGHEWFNAQGFRSPLVQFTSSAHKFHVFFRHPGNGITIHPSVKALHDQIDIRGDGSYVVASPSIHPSGAMYRMVHEEGYEGGLKDLPVLPEIFWGSEKEEPKPTHCHTSENATEATLGARNATLTSKCGEWYARGMHEEEVMVLASAWNASHCQPPMEEKEVSTIVSSMSRTHGANNPGMLNTDGVAGWIGRAQGEFSVSDIYRDLSVVFAGDKSKVRFALDDLERSGVIERSGGKDGVYRKLDTSVEDIDLDADEGRPIDMWLPFGLHRSTYVYPGNVIVVAGETNSGKTSLLLDIVHHNPHHKFRYLSSEMTATELKGRIKAFGMPIQAWKEHCEFKQRSRNFGDAVDPDAINIIDFLEMSDDFFKANAYITQIFNRLRNGIAIVCLQKKRGEMFGRGGEFTLEKARLGLSLFCHGHIPSGLCGSCIVTKAKNIRTSNPQDKEVFYRLTRGSEYAPLPVASCPTARGGLSYYSDKERRTVIAEVENWCRVMHAADVEEEF